MLFPFSGVGLSVGFLAEGVRIVISSEKRWTKDHSLNPFFNLLMFCFLGILQDHFYAMQAKLSGTGTSLDLLDTRVRK